MTDPTTGYLQLERNFCDWAGGQPAIQSAVVVGSRAGTQAGAWSDLDVLVFTSAPGHYAANANWLSELGSLWLAVPGRTGHGDPEWRALYAGGLKADFVLTRADGVSALNSLLDTSAYRLVFEAGLRPLFDKNAPGSLPAVDEFVLPRSSGRSRDDGDLPAAIYQALMDAALLDATQTARLLRRGELWRAKQHCDCDLKQHLLSMLVWKVRLDGDSVSTARDDGRHMESWVDPVTAAALPATFAAYSADDVWRALFATLDLFLDLARQTARLGGYAYPGATIEPILAWLGSMRPAQS
jgi:aminoglycoside 6-adenylyltransferase